MKKYFNILIIILLLAISFGGAAQQQNPALANPTLVPEPLSRVGEDFDIGFDVGNTGTQDIPGNNSAQRMRFDMTLGKCIPATNGTETASITGLDAISGTALLYFDISYDISTKTYTAIQKLNTVIPAASLFTFVLHAVVTELSLDESSPQIGASIDITPNAAAVAVRQSELDDTLAIFTYTAIILPVAGVTLKTVLESNQSKLIWESLGGQNAAYFQIERSDNGSVFYTIKKVDVSSAEAANTTRTHSFLDTKTATGTVYYRVLLFNKEGKYNISNTAALTRAMQPGIEIFPNPARNFITLTGLTAKQFVVIYNVDGKKITQRVVTSSSEYISISKLALGTYFVQIIDNNKVVSSNKIIIQH